MRVCLLPPNDRLTDKPCRVVLTKLFNKHNTTVKCNTLQVTFNDDDEAAAYVRDTTRQQESSLARVRSLWLKVEAFFHSLGAMICNFHVHKSSRKREREREREPIR